MSATYKVLSAALSYPTAEFQSSAQELVQALIAERLLSVTHMKAVCRLIEDVAAADLLEAQSAYVDLFDRTRSLSLHLFEHVHGESRDRGQAMVSLLERYRDAGLDIAARELPDFIPLFLEYLSVLNDTEARANLAEPAHILAALGDRLRRRGSGYAAILEALAKLSEPASNRAALESLRLEPIEELGDLAALDESWEETEVRFGPGEPNSDGCPRVRDILQRMDTPAGKESSELLTGGGT